MAGKWRPTQVHNVESGSFRSSVERKLVSHVPDLVVYDKNPGKIPHVQKFDGVLLFADVSGFTALTEKYTQSSEKGTDALTVTLNAYIGKIVQNILQLGGDILKFAGDAILAVWKVTKRKYLCYAISQAAKCSLTIQEKCDNQLTDVGVKLRVKIAISAGKIYSTFVGNEKCRYFVMAGRPVLEVNAAEKYCAAGLVVLSPNALELSERDNIIFDPLGERFGRVRYLRHDPRKTWHEYVDLPDGGSKVISDKNIIRIALRLMPTKEREDTICKYVTDVVQRKLDDNQPLKFLSEMRQCSIAFINMAFDLNERDRNFHDKQCQNMQHAFDIVYNCTSDMQGSLNKIFMFDKGCTFLSIFGLPGDKHEEEPAHALQAAWRITQDLKHLETLSFVSIGVTTGPVFCGVIGHEERHEYTVIGQKVNLAARLMMHYPGVVSCDPDTFIDSKLSKDLFTQLPVKAMKGCGEVIVREYTEGVRKPIGKTSLVEPEYPLLGRDDEVNIFMQELILLKTNRELGLERRVIVFESEAGYGKSRVMEEIQWRASKENVRVVAFPLAINDAKTPYFTLKTLIELLLGIQGTTEQSVREKALLCATNDEDRALLCVLNDIIAVDFPRSENVKNMSSEHRTREMHRLVVQIVHKISGSRFVLFALDDAQNVDNDSWEFITTLSKDSQALCVMAMRPFTPDKPSCEGATQVLGHPKTMYVKIGGLPNGYMGALVCQILKVQRIPAELERVIIERSHGVPRWCEQLLQEMQKSELIFTVYMGRSRTFGNQSYASIDASLVKRNLDREVVYQPDIPFHQQQANQQEQVDIRRESNSTSIDIHIPERTVPKEPSSSRVDEIVEVPDQEQQINQRAQFDENEEAMEQLRKTSRLRSLADRITWHKSSTTLMEFLRPSKTKLQESFDELSNGQQKKNVAMECVIKPGFDINKFPVPASIRGMALARLDRMKQYDQLIVKCAAIIGENFSRKMLSSVLPGFQEHKFKKSIFELMRLRVFQCASTVKDVTDNQAKTLGRISHRISCDCKKKSQSVEDQSQIPEEEIAAGCEQLMFINSLVQETAYDLWLENQKKSLHEACAVYLEAKISEVLITGVTDDVIAKQFRLSKVLSGSSLRKAMNKESTIFSSTKLNESVSPTSWKTTGTVPGESSIHSVKVEKLSSKSSFTSKMSDNSLGNTEKHAPKSFSLGLPTDNQSQRRVSSSVIGRMHVERVGAHKLESMPLNLNQDRLPDDSVSNQDADEMVKYMAQAKALNVDIANVTESDVDSESYSPRATTPTNDRSTSGGRRGNAVISAASSNVASDGRRMSYSPLWSQSVGLSNSYERMLLMTENEAKRLTGFQLDKVFRTPYELHDVFALLYSQLVYHWRKAANTQKTIDYLLKAGDSCIATLLLTEAKQHLEDASEIIQNLAKGNDIVAKVNEDDDDGGIDDVKVLSVSRDVKARVQSLLGQVLYQQGLLDQSYNHFLKALKIMRCRLPTNRIMIPMRLWYENNRQSAHIKNPQNYIGKAGSKLANKYVEQVRCLSYLWQILLNLRRVPNRVMLAKLVTVMQVNRAEAADDDLQELITSYTYMMQISQLTGDLQQSAFYENRATQRCLELPSKLTAADLYITGHLHLVSCSIRLCSGKLLHATTSGYRAYAVADSLHDLSVKVIVLPLLAQIHMLTGKPRACVEVLDLLKHVASQDNDEAGTTSYFSACMDLILDGGYRYENSSECVEYLQDSESTDVGDVSRLYVRASMAVWCFRQHEKINGKAWLTLAEQAIPDFFDNFHSVRAYTRVLEAYLLVFKGSIEKLGQKNAETVKLEKICNQHLKRLSKLCKHFPAFLPRNLHLKAYFNLLTGQSSKAREMVTQAASMARYCGNSIDRKWALHSQQLWFSFSSLPNDDVNFWEYNCTNLPHWANLKNYDHINRQFSLKAPDAII